MNNHHVTGNLNPGFTLEYLLRGKFASRLVAVFCITIAPIAWADGSLPRTNSWEFTVMVPYVAAEKTTLKGGSEFDTNSDVGLGFSTGYNYNEHLAANMSWSWNWPKYDATIVSADVPALTSRQANGELGTATVQFNMLYNFKPGPITPLVSGGIGWTFIDTGIASDLPPTETCWWDPFYGYICYNHQPTYADWRFSYNAAVGLRWQMTDRIFLRGNVGLLWIDLPQGGNQDYTVGRLEFGFRM